MTISSDLVQVALVKETARGTTPATPAFKLARITGESIGFAPSTGESGELNPKRGTTDTFLTGGEANGDLQIELSNEALFHDLIAAVLGGAWVDNKVVVGKQIIGYTIEKKFAMETTEYHRYPGMVPSKLSLSLSPNSQITGSIGFMGATVETAQAAITGATYTDPEMLPVMTTPFTSPVVMEGVTQDDGFTSLSIELNANNRNLQAIGTLGAVDTALGKFTATLSGSLYFSNSTLLNKLKAQEALTFELQVNDTSTPAKWLKFKFGKIKLTDVKVVAGGTGSDVLCAFTASAVIDPATGSVVEVTRSA